MSGNKVAKAVRGGLAYVTKTEGEAIVSASSALPLTAKQFGITTEDGVTITNATSTEEIRGWQGKQVIRTETTDEYFEITAKFVQNLDHVLELFYGSAPTTTPTGRKIDLQPTKFPKGCLVVDFIDSKYGDESGSLGYFRYVLPDTAVVNRGEITGSNGDVIGYEITFRAYADASTSSVGTLFVDEVLPEPEAPEEE